VEHPPRWAAIDAHNHLGRWLTHGDWAVPEVGRLLEDMATANVAGLVNLDGLWDDELESNLDRYDRAYPGVFATFCQLDWREVSSAGFGERLASSLARSAAAGAKGVKVWKDLGLGIQDPDDALLLPGDERLSPIWQTAAELGLPVLIHTADPLAFFRQLDESNERIDELTLHPEWWFGDRSRFPKPAVLFASLEALVAAHPDTTFIAAHAGCAEDLGWLGRMFDSYPNFNADIAARIAELGRKPAACRALFRRHADRLLFGTDEFPPDLAIYSIGFRFLETADQDFAYSTDEVPPQGRWTISGLNLPSDALEKIERSNALRLIPGLSG
jgi:predicted TIM-barrel fold metal-dependent hydrolase